MQSLWTSTRRTRARSAMQCLLLALLYGCAGMSAVSSKEGQEDQEIAVDFEGNGTLTDRELYRHIEDSLIAFASEPGRTAIAFDAAQDLQDYYLTRGFPDANVRHVIRGDSVRNGPGRMLAFEIAEGQRVVVRKLELGGNILFSDDELLPLWSRTQSGLLGLSDPFFVAADLRTFAASIVARYRSTGFLDATVDGPMVARERSTSSATVALHVHEGARYLTDQVLVVESLRVDGFDAKGAVGQPYDAVALRGLRIRLQRALEDDGYAVPEIRTVTEVDRAQHTVRVRFEGDRGERRRVASIRLRGNERTVDWLLHRKIAQDRGAWYHGGKVEQSVQDLYATGLFSSVSVQQSVDDQNQLDLEFLVEEAASRDLSFLLGYGSYERARGAVYASENNLFGLGQRLRVGGRVSAKSWSGDATWTEPSLFGSDTSLSVTGFIKERQEPSFTDVSEGVTTALSRRLFPFTQARVGYAFESRDARDVDASVVGASPQTFRIGQVFAELVYDDRDSPLFPSEGQRHAVRFERAGSAFGGSINLSRLTVASSIHVALPWKDWTIGGAFEAGLVWDLDADPLPVQERFFNGGNDSVRSFREAQLGPTGAAGVAIGGEYRNIVSVELRFPLFKALQGAVFGDAGNVGLNVHDYGFSDLRYGVGAGLRLALPIGPLRLDYSRNPDPDAGERTGTLHLSVGLPF